MELNVFLLRGPLEPPSNGLEPPSNFHCSGSTGTSTYLGIRLLWCGRVQIRFPSNWCGRVQMQLFKLKCKLKESNQIRFQILFPACSNGHRITFSWHFLASWLYFLNILIVFFNENIEERLTAFQKIWSNLY